MFTPRSNNLELQRYLQDKSYDTASLGETSADELTLKDPSYSSDSEKRVDIYRESALASEYEA